MIRVICIGECMVELREAGVEHFLRCYAGDVFNTAVYLKRSLPQAHVQFLTATGDDTLSEDMRRAWIAHGIDDALGFRVAGGSPGLYLIETDAQGERRFRYWRSNSAARRWLALLLERGESILWGADIVYLSGIALAILSPGERTAAIELMTRLRAHVGRIAFDPNVRLALWETAASAATCIESAMAACDIALPSTEDMSCVFHVEDFTEQIELLQQWGACEIALTLGRHGCVVAEGAERVLLSCPIVEDVIDTSGAGDAFNGAYLAGRLQGESAARSAQRGLDVASRVITHRGAVVPCTVSHPYGARDMRAGIA